VIIRRYLVREIFASQFGVLLVLILIAAAGQLVGEFSKVADGNMKAGTVMTLLGVYSLTLVPFIIPLALYLGILLALSRLYTTSELILLEACGYGPWRLFGPVLVVAMLMMLVQAAFTVWLSPWASFQDERLEKLSARSLSIEGIRPGRFITLPGGGGVIYVERINAERTRVFNVFARIRQGGEETVLVAESGHIEVRDNGDRYLVLTNGWRYDGRPAGSREMAIVRFQRHGLRMRPPTERDIHYHLRAVSSQTLWQQRHRPGYLSELQWRLASPLLCLALAILAIPLSRTSPRSGRYGRLVLAFVFYLVINNLMNVARAWLDAGKLPAAMGLWWVHAAVILLALLLLGGQLRHFRWKRK